MRINSFLFFLSFCFLPAGFSQLTWELKTSGTTEQLVSIHFVNSNIGYAVGGNGVIVKSTDAGENWVAQASGTTDFLYDVFFIDELVGWACGEGGVVLKTTNGGASWNQMGSFCSSCSFRSIQMLSPSFGVLGGVNSTIAAFYYTTDGGSSWIPVSAPVGMPGCNDVEFLNTSVGFVVDYFDVYRTDDGGGSWIAVSVPAGASQTNVLSMVDENVGYLTGGDGKMFYTTNGGTVWNLQSTPTTQALWGLAAVSADVAFVSGWGGTIMSTHDGGTTWVLNSVTATGIISGMCAISETQAWACGEFGQIFKLQQQNDLELIGYYGTTASCPSSPIEVLVKVKNVGANTINGGVFTMLNGITEVIEFVWTGSLDPGDEDIISLGTTPIVDNAIFTINYTGDDNTTNNSIIQPISLIEPDEYGTNGPFTVCSGETLNLTVYGGASYLWLNATEDSTAQTQHVTINESKDFYVWIKQSQCSLLDTVVVKVENGNCGTSAFTPNNDGVNDFFYIEGLDTATNYVTIFNRWGDLVKSYQNYDNTTVYWDGSNWNNQPLSEGIYFYTVEDKNHQPLKKGWVQVLR